MASSQLMYLAHDEQSCNGTSCAEGLIFHIVIVVAGRAHCFHDCINLVPRAILKTLYFPLIAKRCAGVEDSLQLHICEFVHANASCSKSE